jgi:diaminopropionate ammonia-lyase
MPYSFTHHFHNTQQDNHSGQLADDLFGNEECAQALSSISQWPSYEPTPLVSMTDIAAEARVQKVYYKDESTRFGLGSFKALGGSYAVSRLQQSATTQPLVVCTATDGNHGRSVAWGAQQHGVECHIFIHANVSEARADAMAAFGAVIHRVAGNYDDSIAECIDYAARNHWQIVSDTSWEGYRDSPRLIMAGYSVMTHEILQQLDGDRPTHIILQAGCGGMAGALIASMWQFWKTLLPKIVIVESDRSDCVYQSLKRDEIHRVNIVEETIMAGLSCGEVSELAWPLIQKGSSDVLTINDEGVAPMLRWLANPTRQDRPPIVGGECSASGLIAFLAIRGDATLAKSIGINSDSKVLVIGTEGNTDPDVYQKILQGEL